MPVATFPLGPLQTNSYLIHLDDRAVAVDVGGHPAPMQNYLAEQRLSLPMPTGETSFGGMTCRVLQTPGHTPGGVSLYFPAENLVFTGDALFYRSMGRTDFPGGDHATLLRSIRETLFKLPPETVVYPGHGPATTIGDELKNNPFCGEFRS